MAAGILTGSIAVILNGSGNGTVKLGPLTARETWNPASASVRTTQLPGTVVNEAVCNLFVGLSATQENFRDGTFSGSSGDASDLVGGELRMNNYVWAVWTGGDAGATAVLALTGTKEV
jgi:hypothetical protein